jgi:hypothetical protein
MRRSVTLTLGHIVRKYLKKGTSIESLSLRKQMCIAYLKWASRKQKKFGYEFYDLAQRFRKEENRIGGKRTKIEKIGRKFLSVKRKDKFKETRKPGGRVQGKNLVRQRKGFLAPDKYEEHLRNLKAAAYHKFRGSTLQTWVVYPPEGDPILVKNIALFCEENNLQRNLMIATATRPWQRRHHKGWRAEKYDPEWHKLTGIEPEDGLPTQEDG